MEEGFVKYAVQMGSSAMIHVPCFRKTGSGMKKLTGVGGFTDRQHEDRISLPSFFFKIRKVG
jgi:hypothetical protein